LWKKPKYGKSLIKKWPILDVRTEYRLQVSAIGASKISPLMVRREVGNIVFAALCLTKGERETV
jgi:hypothetical protein